MAPTESLQALGWRPGFQAQCDPDSGLLPARVMAVQRGRVEVTYENGVVDIDLSAKAAKSGITIGDWVLLDESAAKILVRLERFALFQRRAEGRAPSASSLLPMSTRCSS